MPSDVCILVADLTRMTAIREGASLPGRVMPFSSVSIGSAMSSITAYRPKIVAVDALFAQTPAGAAFVDQVAALRIGGSRILLVAEEGDGWITMPHSMLAVLQNARSGAAAPEPPAPAIKPALAAVPAIVAVPAAPAAAGSTRRAPRFLVRGPLNVVAESGQANLVDLSTLGAQITSQPVLRPRQKIKLSLPDADDVLNVVAQVAWSSFERPRLQVEPYYRVGLEFSGDARDSLEEYRRRHCIEQPKT